MPHSVAWPDSSNVSTYIASCARWKPPTPKCTMPVRTSARSYVGTVTPSAAKPARVCALSRVMVPPWSAGSVATGGQSVCSPRRPDDGLDRVRVPARRGEGLVHLVQPVVPGDQPVQLHPAGRGQGDRRGPGVGVAEGAGQGQLTLLDPAHWQVRLASAHPDQDHASGGRHGVDGGGGGGPGAPAPPPDRRPPPPPPPPGGPPRQ